MLAHLATTQSVVLKYYKQLIHLYGPQHDIIANAQAGCITFEVKAMWTDFSFTMNQLTVLYYHGSMQMN